jgi:hypothetical protein
MRIRPARKGEVVTKLEALLRISVVQAELSALSESLDPHSAKVLTYALRIVAMVKPDTLCVVEPKIKSAAG